MSFGFKVEIADNELHYHGCPTCYQKRSCMMNCFVEPDLSHERPTGGYVVCEHCRAFYTRCKHCLGTGSDVELGREVHLLDGSILTPCPECSGAGVQWDGGYDEDGSYSGDMISAYYRQGGGRQ